MTRTEKSITEVAYSVQRVEILDAVRDAIQAKYPGGAAVTHRCSQRCEFLDANGDTIDVAGLVITTAYEEPEKVAAVAGS